jgi:deazaflavin-dependent oxidoreductase (nitroreductase family)
MKMNRLAEEQWKERNEPVIQDFRANGGNRTGAPLLLLTTTGAKTGRRHTTPLMFTTDAGRFVVIASKGGSPTHPAWYHNLVANPRVTLEVGSETFEANAVVAEGAERDRLYGKQAELYPFFAQYQLSTKRKIPLIVFERA